jgi:hypothetical protein
MDQSVRKLNTEQPWVPQIPHELTATRWGEIRAGATSEITTGGGGPHRHAKFLRGYKNTVSTQKDMEREDYIGTSQIYRRNPFGLKSILTGS